MRSILTTGAGLPQPRQAGGLLDVDLPVVPIRDLSAYSLQAISEAAS